MWGLTAALEAILFVLLALFILLSLKSGPHDPHVGVVGQAATTAQFEAALEQASPESFAPQHFDSEANLAEAVRNRAVVGGFVLTDGQI